MKDQEKQGLRRSFAGQIAAALAEPHIGPVGLKYHHVAETIAEQAVGLAGVVVEKLAAVEAIEEAARAEAASRAAAKKADVAAGAQEVEPH